MRPFAFGTDGVRGPTGAWPIDPEGAYAIGLGLARFATQGPVCVGRDTRESGPALEEALVRGLVEGGSEACVLGVLPTAAVSCAVATREAHLGVVITASHNPWTDNGFKVLGPEGTKLEDTEALLACFDEATPHPRPGARVDVRDPALPWLEALPAVDLAGLRVWLDCAHGAAAPFGARVLEQRGARVTLIGAHPDGRNINAGVGAMHPTLCPADHDVALFLDGDADRVVLSTRDRILDGDDLLALFSTRVQGPLVGTIMSNGGLEALLGERLLRAPVGDAHVAALMAASGAQIGAEPSGHVLFRDGPPTSDGLTTALRALALGLDAATAWPRLPTASCKAPARDGLDLEALPSVQAARAEGYRVVIRRSGTEPVIRVHVEGPEPAPWAHRIEGELRT